MPRSTPRRRSIRFRPGVVISVGLSGALLLSACAPGGTTGSDGTIKLKFAHYMPSEHIATKNALDVWKEEVESKTDGKVEIEYYPGGQLVGPEEMLSSLKSRVIDVGFFVPANAAAAELPLSNVAAVPSLDASAEQMQDAYWDLLRTGLAEDDLAEQGLHPLMGVIVGRYQLISKKPVKSVEDWRGRSVRSAGGSTDFLLTSLKASPVHVAAPEEYEALQRGTVDSGVNTIESLEDYDLQEVVQYSTTNAPLGGGPTMMVIRQEVWDDLPSDVQKVMEEAGSLGMDKVIKAYTDELSAATNELDLEFYELTDQQLAKMQPAVEAAQNKWVKQTEAAGKPGRETLDAWEAALQKAGATP